MKLLGVTFAIVLALCLSEVRGKVCYNCQWIAGCTESSANCVKECKDPFEKSSTTSSTTVQCSTGCYKIDGTDEDGNEFVARGCNAVTCEDGVDYKRYLSSAVISKLSNGISPNATCCTDNKCNGSGRIVAFRGLIGGLLLVFASLM